MQKGGKAYILAAAISLITALMGVLAVPFFSLFLCLAALFCGVIGLFFTFAPRNRKERLAPLAALACLCGIALAIFRIVTLLA